ncbi:MAG: GH39 family glycosyl hydrolase, partial [Planctomycetota bacterium]
MGQSKHTALGLATLVCLGAGLVSVAENATNEGLSDVTVTVHIDRTLGELYDFWNVFPVTVQAPFKITQRHEELRQLYPHAKYINCVRFLGGKDLEKDDYFRGVNTKGEAICDFTEGIALLRGIRDAGFTPWIVLDNVPAAMSENPVKNKYGNTEPPEDFGVWSSYVRQLARALVEEFGAEEVGRWRFRVGTEPDLKPGHWSGTKADYLAHYDHTVAAVTSVLPNAEIGPGNILDPGKKRKWDSWGLEIIDHCATGVNHATGKIGTPMRFFASSYYTAIPGTDERFGSTITLMRERLARYPQFNDVPVEVHEFGILTENGKLIAGDGTEFSGSWMAHMANKIYTLGVQRVYQWHWNTTKAGGLPIPLTHVMGMLDDMVGGQRLSAETSGGDEADDIGCIAVRKDGAIHLLVYRHLAVRDNGEPRPIRLLVKGKRPSERPWKVTGGSIIDGDHA